MNPSNWQLAKRQFIKHLCEGRVLENDGGEAWLSYLSQGHNSGVNTDGNAELLSFCLFCVATKRTWKEILHVQLERHKAVVL